MGWWAQMAGSAMYWMPGDGDARPRGVALTCVGAFGAFDLRGRRLFGTQVFKYVFGVGAV